VSEAFGFSVPTQVEQLADPSRTAVVIYDMQVGIISQIAEGPAVLGKCLELVAAARESGYRIFFTRHMWLPLRAAGVGQLRRAMIWQGTEDSAKLVIPFLPGSGPWEIAAELNPGADDVLVDKITMSAFTGTFLDIALRDARIESFIIAGIALEVGIEPTVRHGADLNYIPIVVTDACGSMTPDLKERTLHSFETTGEVITVTTSQITSFMTHKREIVPGAGWSGDGE
jgi:nicotinamidase-related amidase